MLLPTYLPDLHPTETAVLKIVSNALLVADRNDMMLLGLLDLSTASDMIDHNILINRLHTAFKSTCQFFLGLTNSFSYANTNTDCHIQWDAVDWIRA